MLSVAENDVPQDVLKSLQKAGLRAGERASYPLVAGVAFGMPNAEEELFRWFVYNERLESPNQLPPLDTGDSLPSIAKVAEPV